MTPTFLDHLVFRVVSLAKTEPFYTAFLGAPVFRTDSVIVYAVGPTRLFFTPAPPQTEPYDKDHIGLNHLAFGVHSLSELQTLEAQLNTASIKHSGIMLDPHGQKDYIWFDDPDNFRVEFYLRTE